MRDMTAVRVDAEHKIGFIQGGASAHRAAVELFKHRPATPVGFVSNLSLGF